MTEKDPVKKTLYKNKEQTTITLKASLASQQLRLNNLQSLPIIGKLKPIHQKKLILRSLYFSIIFSVLLVFLSIGLTWLQGYGDTSLEKWKASIALIDTHILGAATGEVDDLTIIDNEVKSIKASEEALLFTRNIWFLHSREEDAAYSALSEENKNLLNGINNIQKLSQSLIATKQRVNSLSVAIENWNQQLRSYNRQSTTDKLLITQLQQQLSILQNYLIFINSDNKTGNSVNANAILANINSLYTSIASNLSAEQLNSIRRPNILTTPVENDLIFLSQAKTAAIQVALSTHKVSELNNNLLKINQQNQFAKLAIIWLVLLSFMALSAVLAGFFAWWKNRYESVTNAKLQQSMLGFTNAMTKLASGDLREHLNMQDDVIMMTLSDSYNQVIDNFSAIVSESVSVVHQVLSVVKEISGIHEQLKIAVEEQNEKAVYTNNSLTNTSNQAKQINQLTKDAANSSSETARKAKMGASSAELTKEAMLALDDTMQNMRKVVKQLSESAQKASDTVNGIEKITEKTQILALNASLIAAQAQEGEGSKSESHSKGFRAIAKEVESLANNSKNELENIQREITTMSMQMQNTISTIEEAGFAVTKSKETTEEGQKILSSVADVAVEMNEKLKNIANITNEQQSNVASGAVAMGSIQEISNLSMNLLSKFEAVMTRLKDTSGQLKKSVETNFTIADHKGS